MTRKLTLIAAFAASLCAGAHAFAQETVPEPDVPVVVAPLHAAELHLDEMLWIKRPVVVFADTPADPRFIEQMRLLAERPEVLAEREVVVIVDTDPAARSDVRLKLRPRGFMLVVIGKDGQVALRKPSPWDVRELTRAIDKMPLRQDELRRMREDG
jgi:hypothetical protein